MLLHCTTCAKDVEATLDAEVDGAEGFLTGDNDTIDITIPLQLSCPECDSVLKRYKAETSRVVEHGQIEAHNKCFIIDGDDYDEPDFRVTVGTVRRKFEMKAGWGVVHFTVHLICNICTVVDDMPDSFEVPWNNFS